MHAPSLRRRPSFFLSTLATATVALAASLGTASADEGMWLFNNPPTARLKEKYHFEPTQPWLDHLQKASVRFNSGGSGSFVSADGLVITNHHVGADALQKFGDAQHNYLRDGFYAKTRGEEKKCLDLELNVLMAIEDVTARVKAAVKPGLAPEAALAARRAVIADIEKESKEKTGLRSDVVTLYQGGAYHLYRFKRYDDVRLVFAPEQAIAFYGGDPDNFEYPRFDLDICIFRAYENGQPAHPEQSLKWSQNGPPDHGLVFVSGHPGSTSRQLTLAELADQRDRGLPRILARLYRRETLLHSYSERSFENARKAREDLFGIQNGRKALEGRLDALLDPDVGDILVARETKLRSAIAGDAKLADTLGAYDKIQSAQSIIAANSRTWDYFEGRRGHPAAFNSTLFELARTLVRAGDERAKPNGERLPEFRDSGKESLELRLFSEEPIYDDFEELALADSLTDLAGAFGDGDPMVQSILANQSPRVRAHELVSGSKLKDVAMRRQLLAGGTAAIAASKDPMIVLAQAVDSVARSARKNYETQDEIKQQAYGQIAVGRFATEGATNFPDATFTLRLSYGAVSGYEENGKAVPAFTNFAGLYQRAAEHENKTPFELPPRWVERKDRLNPNTPFNFICTADIIGGNSGSPVVNAAGEFVGIIFDGNIQSLALDYVYTDKQARAVSVDSRAIMESLRVIYDAAPLADELAARPAVAVAGQ